METVAYIQLTQEFESESKQVQFSAKTIATVVTVAGTAWTGGLLSSAPALAYHYGCCRPRPIVHYPVSCCRPRPVVYKPISYCQQSCYYPQPKQYDNYETSYYPEYYEDYSHKPSYEDYSHKPSYEEHPVDTGYQEIVFFPEHPNFLTLGSSGQIVTLLQQELAAQGYHVGPIDGLYGHKTADAVAAYQHDAGLLVDGIAGGQTLDSLGLAGAGA